MTPPDQGTYVITAVFPGSSSYWGSYASTAIGVTAEPPAAATPEQVEEAASGAVQAVQNLHPLVVASIIIGIAAICLVTYDLAINRKMLKQIVERK